jgi:hypothetical protein
MDEEAAIVIVGWMVCIPFADQNYAVKAADETGFIYHLRPMYKDGSLGEPKFSNEAR